MHVSRLFRVRLKHLEAFVGLPVVTLHDTLQEVLLVQIVASISDPLSRPLLQASVKVKPVEVHIHGARGSPG